MYNSKDTIRRSKIVCSVPRIFRRSLYYLQITATWFFSTVASWWKAGIYTEEEEWVCYGIEAIHGRHCLGYWGWFRIVFPKYLHLSPCSVFSGLGFWPYRLTYYPWDWQIDSAPTSTTIALMEVFGYHLSLVTTHIRVPDIIDNQKQSNEKKDPRGIFRFYVCCLDASKL